MGNTHSASLIEHLSVLEDPRIDRAKRHSLTDALTIAICAIVGGADSWTDVEIFGNSKRQWFDSFLELPNGIPSHDTFGRVFSMLDAEQLVRDGGEGARTGGDPPMQGGLRPCPHRIPKRGWGVAEAGECGNGGVRAPRG